MVTSKASPPASLEGEKIRRASDYDDFATVLGQLRLMPAPSGTPTG
jgi:hypothetical protein